MSLVASPQELSASASPLLACPVCRERFTQEDLQTHLAQKHPPAQEMRKEESEASVLDDSAVFIQQSQPVVSSDYGGGGGQSSGALSIGLAYQSDVRVADGSAARDDVYLGLEAEESQPHRFQKLPLPEDTTTQSVKDRQNKRLKTDGTIKDLARQRKQTEVIDLDKEEVDLVSVASSEVEEPLRKPSPEASSIPEVEEVLPPVPRPSPPPPRHLVLEMEKRKAREQADVVAFIANNQKKAAAKSRRKQNNVVLSPEDAYLEDDDDDDDDEVMQAEMEAQQEDSSHATSNSESLAGFSMTTRRRRKGIEEIVGSKIAKRSEAKVFAELAKRARKGGGAQVQKDNEDDEEEHEHEEEEDEEEDQGDEDVEEVMEMPARRRTAEKRQKNDDGGKIQKLRARESSSAKKQKLAPAKTSSDVGAAIALALESPVSSGSKAVTDMAPPPPPPPPSPAVDKGKGKEEADDVDDAVLGRYSQIPKEQIGHQRIYDLSQPSMLQTSDEPPPEMYEEDPRPKKSTPSKKGAAPGPPAGAAAGAAGTPSKKGKQAAAVTPGRGKAMGDWTRGRVAGHEVRFCEPRNPKKMFAGFHFIVTGCKVVNELDPPEKHISYFVNVGSDGEPRKQVLADWITDVIAFHGGKELLAGSNAADVLMNRRLASLIEPVSGTPFGCNVICISEKPHRTMKWLLSVAAGIPCVKWKWLHECIKHNKLMDYTPFLLKIGYSVMQKKMVPYKPRNGEVQLLFDDKKMEIVGSPRFVEYWGMILKEQGAECVKRLGVGSETSLKMILAEQTLEDPSDDILRKARSLKCPVVSIEYVIQCLLDHKLWQVKDHPEFQAKRLEPRQNE